MIVWFFEAKFFLLKYNHHCECFFIVFVKFLGWIIAIWVKLVMLIEEKGGTKVLKGVPTTQIKYITSKKFFGPRGPEPPLGSVLKGK